MNKLLKALRRILKLESPPKVQEFEDIKPGQCWEYKGDSSPWARDYVAVVFILDVKDGWVRYRMSATFPDCRLQVGAFLRCYRKV